MSIHLTTETEARIQQKLNGDRYASADQLVREALEALDERDRLRLLRASLVEAEREIERGEGVEWTPDLMEQLNREGEELYRQGATPDPDVCP